ncbi:putative holin-like toxin [Cytobacillus sp. Hm23]
MKAEPVIPYWRGGDALTVYEAVSLMVSFGILIIAILSFDNKK